MVKMLCHIILFISYIVNVNNENDKISFVKADTINCVNEYRERYTMNGVPITYCDVPPRLELSSEQYLDLISGQLSKSNYNDKYLTLLILIDEEGLPNCITIMNAKVFNKGKGISELDASLILEWSNKLKFVPAKNGDRSVCSFYFLTVKKNLTTEEWAFPTYFK